MHLMNFVTTKYLLAIPLACFALLLPPSLIAIPAVQEKAWSDNMDAALKAEQDFRNDEAISLYRQAMEQAATFGSRDERLGKTAFFLADLYRRMGKYADAEPLYRQALEIRQERLGQNHADVGIDRKSVV